MLGELNERFRSVKVGPDNLIYLLTDSRQGRLLRLRSGAPGEAEMAKVAKASGEAAPTTQVRLQMDTEFEKARGAYVYDPARGRALFAENCASCHSFGEFKSGRIGPDLNGVMGRRSGTGLGYDYSPAFRKPETQITWRRDTLSGFLSKPAVLFPGTKMNVAGVASFTDRETLGDYLIGAPAGRRRTAPGAAAKP
jgi:cytochrome c